MNAAKTELENWYNQDACALCMYLLSKKSICPTAFEHTSAYFLKELKPCATDSSYDQFEPVVKKGVAFLTAMHTKEDCLDTACFYHLYMLGGLCFALN